MKRLAAACALLLVLAIPGCAANKSSSSVSASSASSNSSGNSSSSDSTSASSSSTKSSSQKTSGKAYGLNEPATVNGVSITVTKASLEPVIGDRTSSNVAQENGPYFANGSDIVKAADYQNVKISFKIENKSQKAYTFSAWGLKAKSQTDYELTNNIFGDSSADVQTDANSENEFEALFTIKKSISITSVKLTYSFLNYNSEWSDDIGKVTAKSMTESQYSAKYKPVALNFDVSIQ